MSDKTAIEWTDATWNPIRGCSRVSQGCVHCYAEGVARRFSGPGQPYEGLINQHGSWNGNIRFVDHALDQPQRWKRPRRIFVNSMSDLFHENVDDKQIDRIFRVMESKGNHHTYQILTKRPRRMRDYMLRYGEKMMGPPPNAWLGVSVEDQAAADERIPLLLQTPAKVRFLSCEPLLGPILLDNGETSWLTCNGSDDGDGGCCESRGVYGECFHGIDWVIAGGESGRGARPMEPDWARSLRDQCVAAGISYFFKQWGEHLPAGQDGNPDHKPQEINASSVAIRVGKKVAGRLLDGRIWNEYPVTQ